MTASGVSPQSVRAKGTLVAAVDHVIEQKKPSLEALATRLRATLVLHKDGVVRRVGSGGRELAVEWQGGQGWSSLDTPSQVKRISSTEIKVAARAGKWGIVTLWSDLIRELAQEGKPVLAVVSRISQLAPPSWDESEPTLKGWRLFLVAARKYVEAGGDVHPNHCLAFETKAVIILLLHKKENNWESMKDLEASAWLESMDFALIGVFGAQRTITGLELKLNANGTPRWAEFASDVSKLFLVNSASEKEKKKAIIAAVSKQFDNIAQELEKKSLAGASSQDILAEAVQRLQIVCAITEQVQAKRPQYQKGGNSKNPKRPYLELPQQEVESEESNPAKKRKVLLVANKKCYYCDSPQHTLRACPEKIERLKKEEKASKEAKSKK